MRMPSRAPSTAIVITRGSCMSKPSVIRAGIVTATPKAIDSPAEPAVCTMLFSRMVARRRPKARESQRKIEIESTATGMDALTVRPVFSAT